MVEYWLRYNDFSPCWSWEKKMKKFAKIAEEKIDNETADC
jgi:hypothetical protein